MSGRRMSARDYLIWRHKVLVDLSLAQNDLVKLKAEKRNAANGGK